MPAAKKREVTNEDSLAEGSMPGVKTTKSKGRNVAQVATKKGKDDEFQKEVDVESDIDEDDAEKNGQDAVGLGKGAAKKVASKETNKKAPKRGVGSDSSDKQEESVELGNAAKPRKVAKKGEVLPTRRGGDRAAKKVAVENLNEGKTVVKKGRGAAGKKNVAAKVTTKSRGRLPKSAKPDSEPEDSDEISENETAAATVAVEH